MNKGMHIISTLINQNGDAAHRQVKNTASTMVMLPKGISFCALFQFPSKNTEVESKGDVTKPPSLKRTHSSTCMQ
jgi:hypothetical protein